MLDVKAWLETTGMKVAEDRFLKPPSFPYIVFTDNTDVSGADNKNFLVDRMISIEMYSDKINRDAEQNIELLLNQKSINYKRYRTWIDSEKFFQTVYDFNLLEKI